MVSWIGPPASGDGRRDSASSPWSPPRPFACTAGGRGRRPRRRRPRGGREPTRWFGRRQRKRVDPRSAARPAGLERAKRSIASGEGEGKITKNEGKGGGRSDSCLGGSRACEVSPVHTSPPAFVLYSRTPARPWIRSSAVPTVAPKAARGARGSSRILVARPTPFPPSAPPPDEQALMEHRGGASRWLGLRPREGSRPRSRSRDKRPAVSLLDALKVGKVTIARPSRSVSTLTSGLTRLERSLGNISGNIVSEKSWF